MSSSVEPAEPQDVIAYLRWLSDALMDRYAALSRANVKGIVGMDMVGSARKLDNAIEVIQIELGEKPSFAEQILRLKEKGTS